HGTIPTVRPNHRGVVTQGRTKAMTRKTWFTLGGGLASVALLAASVAVLHAQQQKLPRVDRGKSEIELPIERMIARAENDAKALNNPKVPPGKVAWHANFNDASAAAKKSGKPVLLFQMMGKLDDKFC